MHVTLKFFFKGKRLDATVDFVFSGSRLKLFVPKETCLITFLIGGIECPRTERPRRDGKPGMEPGKFIRWQLLDILKVLDGNIYI